MPIKAWSTTASSNATADSASGIIWSEGQAPSSINDSARAMMAELAEYFKDNDGTLTTAGTSTAYTVTNNGSFTSLADGLTLSVTIDETCGASPTLNVNSLGAKKLRKFTPAGEADLAAGDLVANCHYALEYDSAANGGAGAWIVTNLDSRISTFGATLVDDADAATARSTLGVAWQKVGSYTLDGLSAQDITVPSGAKVLRLTAEYVPSTAGAGLYVRISRDGGSTFLSTSGDYFQASLTHSGTTVSAAGNAANTAFLVSASSSLTVASHLATAEIYVGNSTVHPRYQSRTILYDATSGTRNTLYGGHVATTGAANAIRVLVSSGTFTQGTLIVEAA